MFPLHHHSTLHHQRFNLKHQHEQAIVLNADLLYLLKTISVQTVEQQLLLIGVHVRDVEMLTRLEVSSAPTVHINYNEI